ncbi:MAG: hypothetical protein H6Q73_3655 [Firmicutes bacterium]|nr:hypothetical protein [Bacillota bacterium]
MRVLLAYNVRGFTCHGGHPCHGELVGAGLVRGDDDDVVVVARRKALHEHLP